MKKYLLFIICSLVFCSEAAPAQTLTQAQMIEQVNEAAANVHTLTCQFIQTKESSLLKAPIVSTGQLYYTDHEQLRWEYLSPYPYQLIINGEQMKVAAGTDNQHINMQQSTTAKRITQTIMKGAKGKFLDDQHNFNVSMQQEGTFWTATLIPKQNRMKRLFVKAELTFDTMSQMLQRMTLYEKNGDKTTIVLKDIKKNVALDDQLFTTK